VSSDYHLLCLSHDPAIAISYDLTLAEIEAATRDHEALLGHQGCDIMAGRFSYPLVEAGCFGRQMTGQSGCGGYHTHLIWTDRDWLRLLVAATDAPAAVHGDVLDPFVSRCWPLERLRRLRRELGMATAPSIQCHITGCGRCGTKP
jgi:hypothetical protein